MLAPLAAETGGLVKRLSSGVGNVSIPAIVPIKGVPRASADRLFLKMTTETELTGVNRLPLFAGFFGLALLFLMLGSTWYREGR